MFASIEKIDHVEQDGCSREAQHSCSKGMQGLLRLCDVLNLLHVLVPQMPAMISVLTQFGSDMAETSSAATSPREMDRTVLKSGTSAESMDFWPRVSFLTPD